MTDRLAKATPTHHPLLKLSRYEHGGGRLFIDGESGARELIADFYSEGNREFYSQAFADVEWLLAECDTLRAQLAAREGEIAMLGDAIARFRHTPEDRHLWETEDGRPNSGGALQAGQVG